MFGFQSLKPYGRTNYVSYEKCSEFERQKLNQGYKRIKDYDDFILYGRYDSEGRFLYRECFSRFDIEGVKSHKKKGCHGRIYKY